MRKLFLAFALTSAMAGTAGAICTQTGGVLDLEIPRLGDSGAVWAACLQRNFEKISIGRGGHFIEDDGVPAIQRSTMNFVGTGISVTDVDGKTQINISGGTGDVIRSTTVFITGEVTTTSTAWESIVGSTASVFTETSAFLTADFSCNLECDSFTKCPVNFGWLIDGAFVDGETSDPNTGILFLETDGMSTGSPESLRVHARTQNKLNIGTHTVTLLWASPTTRTIRMGRNVGKCTVKYSNDLNAINSGSLANVLGVTDFGAQTTVSLRTLQCSVLPCIATTSDTAEIYTATGTLVGQWRSINSNTGP